jgi:hypothetical protein
LLLHYDGQHFPRRSARLVEFRIPKNDAKFAPFVTFCAELLTSVFFLGPRLEEKVGFHPDL